LVKYVKFCVIRKYAIHNVAICYTRFIARKTALLKFIEKYRSKPSNRGLANSCISF